MRSTRVALVFVLTSAAGCGAGSTEPSSQAASTSAAPPTLEQLRASLVSLHDHAFTADEQARGCPADQSLGAYLALLDQNTEPDPDDPGAVRERTGGCDVATDDAMWPAADPAYWPCTVRAHANDAAGESPWTYELRVRVRRSDAAIDPSWIACPGAS